MADINAPTKPAFKWSVWIPIIITVLGMLGSGGANYTILGKRVDILETDHVPIARAVSVERRLDLIEGDRKDRIKDYEQFKTDIRSDVSEMKTDLKWIRSALERQK